MVDSLDAVAAMPEQKARFDAYRAALTLAVDNTSVAEIQAFIDHSEILAF